MDMEIRVPKLIAFIEYQFVSLLNAEKRDAEERKKHIATKDRDRKEIENKTESSIKKIDSLFKDGFVDETCLDKIKASILAYPDREKAKLNKLYIEDGKDLLEGKEHGQFNNFIFLCWYLIIKEDPPPNLVDIYKWISDFLVSKKYKKKSNNEYNVKDIQQIIKVYKEKISSSPSYLPSYIEYIYSEF